MNGSNTLYFRGVRILAAAALGLHIALASAATGSIRLSIADIAGPAFRATGISFALEGVGLSRLRVRAGKVSAFGRTWKDVQIECRRFRIERSVLACDEGVLTAGEAIPIRFRYDAAGVELQLVLMPGATESWSLSARRIGEDWNVVLDLAQASLTRLKSFIPDSLPAITAGSASGRITATTQRSDPAVLVADLALKGLTFSDSAGLRAGENIAGRLALNANRKNAIWVWKAEVDWEKGEVFWQPIYSRAGHSLAASGTLDQQRVELDRAVARFAGVGEVEIALAYDRQAGRIERLALHTAEFELEPLYDLVLKPMLVQTAAADLRVQGRVQFQASMKDGRMMAAKLETRDVFLEDNNRRFALFGLTATIPWNADEETEARITAAGAELLGFPLGAIDATLKLHDNHISTDQLRIPILSGTLTLNDLEIVKGTEIWQWQFRGGLTPVPLPALMAHFGLPAMQGNISGVIPRVRYEKSTLAVDGALLLRVFDGTVVVKDLMVADPLGIAPRLAAELDARELDLSLITRTFSFGSITGKVDASVKNLQLSSWRPVQFDAQIESSPGRYRKRISQTAVNNISSLGGPGATAAIQRTFLRFFDEFGYTKMGLSCRLRRGVCSMSGVEDTPQGYIIVEGGGIPSITVIGYNREVGWGELLTRLKRVTETNGKPVIK